MTEFWLGFIVGGVAAVTVIAALSFAAVAFYSRDLTRDEVLRG